MLPYNKYVELWNRAYPDKKLEKQKPPADYALSGTSYKTTLEGDEYLLVVGELAIDVYTRRIRADSLGPQRRRVAQAELDGKPARLSLAAIGNSPRPKGEGPGVRAESTAGPHPNPLPKREGTAQQSIVPRPSGHDPRFMVLTLEGKGRHKLELAVRLKISRDGGWRSVDGLLPAAPASACTITVPLAPTELRLSRVADRQNYDIEKPGETITTALGPGGSLAVRWRLKGGRNASRSAP